MLRGFFIWHEEGSEGGAGGVRVRVPIKEMTIKPNLRPENEIARTSETGPVCVGCYPHCRSNTACAIARREGKAKGGNKGKETRGLRTCQIRLELIRSDKSGRVVKHAGADERRERKWGPQLPVLRQGRAQGIYKF